MSFPALAMAVDAAYGLPALDVDWVLYRSVGAGLILGVRSVVAVTP